MTKNQQLAARSFQPQFKAILQAVFQKQSFFRDFFAGGIEALDGVQHNETAFYVKTSDIPVVVGTEYNKDPNVGFGTGTSSSSRFGERTEIVYKDTPVPYDWEWTWHEGIDRHTVNNNLDAAIADRTELQAQAKLQRFNMQHSKFISSVAAKEETLTGYKPDEVLALFNNLSKYYTNIQAVGVRVANVNSDLYNAIVDHPLTTTSKNSTTNIDENGVIKFKGFFIRETPDEMFQDGEVAYVYIQNIGKAFTGINTARTIESEDFDGLAFQGAGKAGEFILDDNKPAVSKVILSTEVVTEVTEEVAEIPEV